MPVALAPVGLTGMQHADGEILACRAAQKFGVPYTLSTMSICSIEEVARHNAQPFWFQLYVMRDREFAKDLVARAKAAKCSALVLTLDLQLLGQRHKDIKNGLSAPPKLTLGNIANLLAKPRWGLGMLGTKTASSATSSAMSKTSPTWVRCLNGHITSLTPHWIGHRWNSSANSGMEN